MQEKHSQFSSKDLMHLKSIKSHLRMLKRVSGHLKGLFDDPGLAEHVSFLEMQLNVVDAMWSEMLSTPTHQ